MKQINLPAAKVITKVTDKILHEASQSMSQNNLTVRIGLGNSYFEVQVFLTWKEFWDETPLTYWRCLPTKNFWDNSRPTHPCSAMFTFRLRTAFKFRKWESTTHRARFDLLFTFYWAQRQNIYFLFLFFFLFHLVAGLLSSIPWLLTFSEKEQRERHTTYVMNFWTIHVFVL